MAFSHSLKAVGRKRGAIDLDFSHCVRCLKEFRVPEPANGFCTHCLGSVVDGRLPAATAEDPLQYSREDHFEKRLRDWLRDVSIHKRLPLYHLSALSASGDTLRCVEEPSALDFPVSVHVPISASAAASSSAASSSNSHGRAPPVSQPHAPDSSRTLRQHGSDPVRVHILEVSRLSDNFHNAFGANLSNEEAFPKASEALRTAVTRLNGIQEALSNEGILQQLEQGREGHPPKLFAFPKVARLSLGLLSAQNATLGRNTYFLHELKSRHIIVEDDLLEAVKEVLRSLPGVENVHVKHADVVEIGGNVMPSPSQATGHARDSTHYSGVDLRDVAHIVVHNTFVHVVLPPSSMWSRSAGQMTASTGLLRGQQPRISRRRIGSPGPQAQHVPGADSQSLPSQLDNGDTPEPLPMSL